MNIYILLSILSFVGTEPYVVSGKTSSIYDGDDNLLKSYIKEIVISKCELSVKPSTKIKDGFYIEVGNRVFESQMFSIKKATDGTCTIRFDDFTPEVD